MGLAFAQKHRHLNWALIDQAMVSGVNFLTGIILARYLGLAEFGVFTLAWLVVEFASGFQHSLVISPMMSIAPKLTEGEKPAYFGAIVVQQFAYAALSFLGCLAGLELLAAVKPEWDLKGLGLAIAVAVLTNQFQNFVRRYFFTMGRVGTAFVNDVIRYVGQLAVLMVLFFTVRMDAGATLWVMSGSAMLATLAGCLSFQKIAWRRDGIWGTTVRNWHFSKWLLLSEILRWGTTNLFFAAAGALLGPAAVGALRASQNLVGLCHIIYLGLENIVPIAGARHFASGGVTALMGYLKKMTLVATLAVGGIVAVAAAVPEFWLALIYGAEYTGNGYLVRLWGVSYILGIFALMPVFGLRAIERTKPIFWAYLACAAFSAAAVYPLVGTFGAVGMLLGEMSLGAIRLAMVSASFFRHIRTRSAD